jgi:Holliday junction resolvasome RuvABC endonuclease subunit
MQKQTIRILAIDPGTSLMGYAYLENAELCDYGVMQIRKERTVKSLFDHVERIVIRLINEKEPDILVLEKNSFSQITENARLTLAVERIKAVARKHKVPMKEYNSRTVRKNVCNNGNSTKKEMAKVIAIIYPEMKAFLESNRIWKERYYLTSFCAVACGYTFWKLFSAGDIKAKFPGNDN